MWGSPTAGSPAADSLSYYGLYLREFPPSSNTRGAVSGFGEPRLLCAFVQPDATQNRLCARRLLLPRLLPPFHWLAPPCGGERVCFIWTCHWPSWPQIMLEEKWGSGVNLHHGSGKYLLRSVRAFANRGDPSRAFKMSHPCLVHLHNL